MTKSLSCSFWVQADFISLIDAKFDPEEGKRFLQGCYIDFDSTEGKLRHLKRKFKLWPFAIH